jgi:hypothetical protein
MKRIIIEIVLVVIVLGLAVVGVLAITRSITDSLTPLKEANSELSTQVTQLLHPTPTILPDPVTIIHEVRSIARLETIQYSVEKVITAETGTGAFAWLTQDRLLLVAHGMVIAGVDMEKLEAGDLWLENGVLHVRLPAAEIFVATLDNDNTYVYERDTSIIRTADPNLETLARQAAEDEIEKAAIADGILAVAQQNAESYLTRFFIVLGYPDVVFEE